MKRLTAALSGLLFFPMPAQAAHSYIVRLTRPVEVIDGLARPVTGVYTLDRLLQRFQAQEFRPAILPGQRLEELEVLRSIERTESRSQRPPSRFEARESRAARYRERLGRYYVLETPSSVEPKELTRAFLAEPLVESIEPNYEHTQFAAPNDPLYANQWHLKNAVEGLDIGAEAAWNVSTGSPSIAIAIVDTGIDLDHPDLKPNLWINPGEVPDNKVDDDKNGYVDDVNGWDFVNKDNWPDDDQFHGTHVAGIVGAKGNNGVGVAGVTWDCRLMALKGLDSAGRGSASNLYSAITYAADNGARVINMSWGRSGGFSQFEFDTLKYAVSKGALPVAAAGNTNTQAFHYPASYGNTVSVASHDRQNRKSSFSTYGFWVDISAPGSLIYSTWPNGTYRTLTGTSMAAPVVAGVAGLIFSHFKDWLQQDVEAQLLGSVHSGDTNYAYFLGTGRVSAKNALSIPLPRIAVTNSELAARDYLTVKAGDTVSLNLRLENRDSAAPDRVDVSVATYSSFAEMLTDTVAAGALAGGAQKEVQGLRFRISEAAPDGDRWELWVRIRTSAGVRFQKIPYLTRNSAAVSLTVPGFFLDDDNTNSSVGNGDHVPDPGEVIEVYPLVKNVSAVYSPKLFVSLETDGVSLKSSITRDVGSVRPGSVETPLFPLILKVGTSVQSKERLEFVAKIADEEKELGRHPFAFLAGSTQLAAPRVYDFGRYTNQDSITPRWQALLFTNTYEYSVGSQPGKVDLQGWEKLEEATSVKIKVPVDRGTFYVNTRGLKNGDPGPVGSSDGMTVDRVSPLVGQVYDGNNFVDQSSMPVLHPRFSWDGVEDDVAIERVEYGLGTSTGKSDVVDWRRWGSFPTDRLSSDYVSDIALKSNGEIWVAFSDFLGVNQFENGAWKKIGLEDGLPSLYVWDVFVDSSDSVWVSTSNGLARFAGGKWTVYGGSSGLSSSLVLAVTQAPDGSIWALTYDGIARFTGSRWTSYSRAGTWVTDIAVDSSSNVWIPAPDGVSRFSGNAWSNYSLGYTAAVEYSEGKTWAATAKGLFYFDGTSWVAEPSLSGVFMSGVAGDGANTYAHSFDTLYQRKNGVWEKLKSGLTITRVAVKGSTVAMSGWGDGVRILDGNSHKNGDLDSDSIRKVVSFEGGVLVMTTYRLHLFQNGAWSASETANGGNSLKKDRKGTPWLASWNGIERRNAGGWEKVLNLAALDVAFDSQNRLWIVESKKVHFYDYQELKTYSVDTGDNYLASVEVDGSDQVWVASSNGLYQRIGTQFVKDASYFGSSAYNYVIAMGTDWKGRTWACSYAGIAYNEGGRWIGVFSLPFSPSNIRGISFDFARETVWIAGADGLFSYSDGEWQSQEVLVGFNSIDATGPDLVTGSHGKGVFFLHRSSRGNVILRERKLTPGRYFFNIKVLDVAGNETLRSSDGFAAVP